MTDNPESFSQGTVCTDALALSEQAEGSGVHIPDKKYAVIVAHFDDGELFHPSLVGGAQRMIMMGHALSETHNQLRKDLYGENGEPGAFGSLDVRAGQGYVSNQEWLNQNGDSTRKCYTDLVDYNVEEMKGKLRPQLEEMKAQGVERLVTHNPWGEYGHPDHRTVEQAVRELGVEYGMEVWEDSIVHTKQQHSRLEGAAYLDAGPLLHAAGANMSHPYYFDEDEFSAKREMFKNAHITGELNGQPVDVDAWTWHEDDSKGLEFPVTRSNGRALFQTVAVDAQGQGRDLLGGLKSGDHQMIMGEETGEYGRVVDFVHKVLEWKPFDGTEPCNQGTPASEYHVSPYYKCDGPLDENPQVTPLQQNNGGNTPGM